MKKRIYILFFTFFYSIWSDAQTIVLNMSKNPPPAALDWLKNPQPIQIIVTSPINLGQAKVKAVVTKGGKTVITTKLASTLPILLQPGSKLYYGTDFWNQNTFDIAASEVNISSGKLKPGDYQICVSLVTPTTGAVIGNATACSNFQVTEFQEPTLSYPDQNTVIAEDKAFGMAFRWSAVTPHYIGVVKYRFQMYEIPNGMTALQAINLTPIEQQDVMNLTQYLWTNAVFKINQAKMGGAQRLRYAWRVQAIDAMNNQPIGKNAGASLGFSEIREFTILPTNNGVNNGTASIQPQYKEPKLFFPNDRASVTATELRNGFTFKWKAVTPQYKSSVKYRFQIFEANSSAPTVQEDITDATEYTWRKEKASATSALTYYTWRVQAIDAKTNKPIGQNNGSNQGYSETWQFNLGPTEFQEPKLSSPINNTTIASSTIKDGINFQWSSITPQYDGMVTYRLQVFKVADGKTAVNALTSTPVLVQDVIDKTLTTWKPDATAKSGKYAWCVQALGIDSKTRSSVPIGSKSGASKGFSETGEFTLESESIYQEPTLASPADKTIFQANQALDGITLKWNEVKPKYNAPVEYLLYIYEIPNGKTAADALSTPPVEKKTVHDTQYKWLKNITANETKFAWRVQAVDPFNSYAPIGKKQGKDKGFSETQEFSIRKTSEYQEPTLVSPINISFNKSDVFGKGIVLKWNPVIPQYNGSIEYSITVLPKTENSKDADYYNTSPSLVSINGGGTVTDKTEYTWRVPDLKNSRNYVWFVEAKDAQTKKIIGQKKIAKGSSEIQEFSVELKAATAVVYSGPQLTQPENGKSFGETDFQKGVALKWSKKTDGTVQIFEMSESSKLEDIVKGNPTQTLNIQNSDGASFMNAKAGKTYAWRLAMKNTYSTAWTFKVVASASYTEPTLVEPALAATITAKSAKEGLTFTWKAVSPQYTGSEKYIFKVYEILDGKTADDALKTTPVLSKEIKKSEIVTNFKLGGARTASYTWKRDEINLTSKKFVWQVQAVDEKSGAAIGAKAGNEKGYSEKGEFSIGANELTEPTLAFPADKGKVTGNDLKEGLTLKWEEVSPKPTGNVKYRVKIYEIPKDKKAVDALKTTPSVNEVVTNKTEYKWKKEYKTDAQFVWNVQALDANDKPIGKKADALKGFSENREFVLDLKGKDDSLSITDCDGKKQTISNKGLDKSTSTADFKNKFVKINQFSMLVREATGNATSLKGKGSIVVSWLKTPIAVEFDGITIDEKTMTITKGDVFALQDSDADDLPKFLKKSEGKKITKANAKALDTKLKKNKDTKLVKDQKLDDKVKEMATDKTPKLPLGINDVLGYTVAISEMKFTPTKNTLVGIAILPYNKEFGGDDIISFAASDVEFDGSSPSKSGGKMVLLEDFNIVDPDNNSYGVTLKAGKAEKPATYIQWGCKGFEMMKASVDVAFPRDWLTPIKEKGEPTDDEKVIGNATADIVNLKDWILSMSLSPCSIQGVDDVELSVKELIFDNSDTRNPDGIKFPSGYTGTTKNDFRGFYLKKAELVLPKFYNKSTDSSGIAVEINKFIITKQGITGNVTTGSKENPLINLESGTVGDFKASVESFELDILNKSLKKAEVKGQIVLPISRSESKKPNALKYTASWNTATKKEGSKIQLVVEADGKINTEIVDGAELTLKKTSNVTMTYVKGKTKTEKGKITANVNLDGEISLEKKVMDKIPVNLTMNFEKLGFTYDNSAPKKKFTFNKGKFSFASPQKKVGGFPVTIDEIEMADDASVATGYDASASLKFKLKLNLDEKISGSAGLEIQGGIKKDKNIYTPSVIGVKITEIELGAKLSAVDLSGKIAFYNNDPTYGDGFKGLVNANFTKVGELTAAVQFGSVKPANATESFRYWYAEGKLVLQKAIPIIGTLGLKGAGVGAWYHMTASKMPELDVNSVAEASDKKETKSGATFTPDSKTLLGFKFTGIVANTASDKTFNGDVTLSAEFNTSGGINYLQLEGSGYVGSGFKERSKAPIQGKLVAKYDFVQEVFDLNVAVKIKHPTVGIAMFETIQDATLSLNIDSKNKIGNEPKWSLTVGTPAAPNKLYYYSVPTWAYFRAGNNLTVNSGFQPATLAGLRSVDPAFNPVMEPMDESAKGGKGFDFGIGFNKSGSTSVGPFSGSYSVGAELNLSMAQYDASNGCVTDKFNYWYARGGIAAWANANISFKGLVSASLGAAGMMQAGAPEPLWIKGRVAGKIGLKVLFVRININASVPFSYGTPCKPKKAAAAETESFTSTDEIGVNDLVEFGDMYMHSSGATDRISPVTLISTFDLSYRDTENTFELESMENGNKIKKTYKVDLDWYVTGTLITNPGAGVHYPGSPKYSGWQEHNMKDQYSMIGKEGDGYSLGTWWYGSVPRNRVFAYGRDHLTRVVATMKVKNASGQWEVVKNKEGKELIQSTRNMQFKTHN